MREIAPPLYEGWRQPDAAMFASSWLRKVSNTCSSHVLICSCWCAISAWSSEALGFCSGNRKFGLHARSPGRFGNERRLQRVDVIGEITARIHATMES